MRCFRWLTAIAVASLGFGACDTQIKSTIDSATQAKIDAIRNCFPGLWQLADGVFDIARLWQLNGGNNPSDPTGLSWSFSGSDITASLTVGSSTISMAISAYGPNGEQRNCSTLSAAGPISPVSELSEAIDNISHQLATEFGANGPFLHGVWSISGGGISATGEGLTGVIGGVANNKELESVSTSAATVSSGAPAVDPSTITDTSSTPNCSLTFSTDTLVIDEEQGQEYPRGTISVTIDDGNTPVNATITFDKSANAVITIEGTTGSFTFNLDAFTLTASF